MESIYVSFQGVDRGGKIKVSQEHVSHLHIGDNGYATGSEFIVDGGVIAG